MKERSVLAISGSLRNGSTNHHILNFLGGLIPADTSYIIYDELALIPPFDPGLDNETAPVPVVTLRNLLANTDGVVICTPEYAFGIPGQLKNMLDWMVSSASFSDKPVALITASLGGETAHAAMLLVLGALNAQVADGARLNIPFIRSKMDGEGNIIDMEAANLLRGVLTAFFAVI
jgi:chromate reductase